HSHNDQAAWKSHLVDSFYCLKQNIADYHLTADYSPNKAGSTTHHKVANTLSSYYAQSWRISPAMPPAPAPRHRPQSSSATTPVVPYLARSPAGSGTFRLLPRLVGPHLAESPGGECPGAC